MSADLRYLSYVRRGLARSIGDQADSSGIPRSAVASVDVAVVAAGEEKPHTMAVRGPGSVVGLAPGEVVRVDPPDGATDHAANMFASVELRTADLPWLFTPARPRGERLIPWLVLVVVEDREGNSLTADGSGLSVLSVGDAARELPDLNEAWAWAHAQVDAEYTDLAALLDDTPELACARLLCPRLLEPDSGYFACVVPSFEAGRLAGLGLTAPADSVELAWTPRELRTCGCRCCTRGAFEPHPSRPTSRNWCAGSIHSRSDPTSAYTTSTCPTRARLACRAGQVTVGYEGALGSPEMRAPPWRDPARAEFRSAMGLLLEDAAPGEPRAEGEPYVAARHDPVVAPPRYGALPAGIDDIPEPDARPTPEAPRWLSQANLDPKYRSAAGLGAEVVRLNQEALMADAWDQARGVGQVNRVLTRTRTALEVGRRRHARLEALPDGALLQTTAGAHARLPGGVAGQTVRGRRPDAAMPRGLVSAAFRRRTRPGSVLARAVTSELRGPGRGHQSDDGGHFQRSGGDDRLLDADPAAVRGLLEPRAEGPGRGGSRDRGRLHRELRVPTSSRGRPGHRPAGSRGRIGLRSARSRGIGPRDGGAGDPRPRARRAR